MGKLPQYEDFDFFNPTANGHVFQPDQAPLRSEEEREAAINTYRDSSRYRDFTRIDEELDAAWTPEAQTAPPPDPEEEALVAAKALRNQRKYLQKDRRLFNQMEEAREAGLPYDDERYQLLMRRIATRQAQLYDQQREAS